MTSWGGTSIVTVLRSTFTILSMNGKRMKSPGPLGPPWTRPRRKMTPRSYSLTIFTALVTSAKTTTTTTTTTIKTTPAPIGAACNNAKAIDHAPLRSARATPDRARITLILSPVLRRFGRRSGQEKGRPVSGLPGCSLWWTRARAGLEQPPRAHVAWDDVYRGFGDHVSYLGVDGGPVARGYTDVGDPAAALGPEDQVTGRRSAPDRGAVAVLSGRRVGKRDPELGVDQHRVARAVLPDVDLARPRGREHVGRAHVGHGFRDHVAPGPADLAADLAG